MKIFVAVAVATLSFVVSSIQGAEMKFHFYTQLADESVSASEDAHFALVNADGQKIVDANLEKGVAELNVEPGEYSIVLEQAKSGFAGATEFAVEKPSPEAVEAGETSSAAFFVLSKDGLKELKDVHECPENHDVEGGESDCDCDEHCVCRAVNKKCNPNGQLAQANANQTGYAQETAPNTIPQQNPQPVPAPQGAGSGMSGAAGAAGAGIGGAMSSIAMAVALSVALPVALGSQKVTP